MSYCTLDDMLAQYGEPLLREATDRGEVATGVVDPAAVAAAIDSGDALIDGYLAVRYALPLATTPLLVKTLSMTVALYKVHAGVASQKVTQDYQDALRQLQQIAQGLMRLDVAGAEPAGSGGAGVKFTDRCRPFTPENLKGYF